MPLLNQHLPYQVVVFDWEGTLGDLNQLQPGALSCIQTLVGRGYRLAIATNKHAVALQQDLKNFQLESYFEITRSASETCAKPDPQMLEEIVAHFQLPVSDMVMVGDSETDILMAKAVNMDAIGLDLQGYFHSSLERVGAKAVFLGYGALLKYLSSDES